MGNTCNKKDLIVICALYIIVLIKSIFASGLGFGLLDEGEYLHNGLRILRGDVPYRDFFSYLPPLYNYWSAFAFKLFGISAFSPRLLNSIIFSFVPFLYYLVVRRFSSIFAASLIALSIAFMELSMERLYYHIFSFSSLLLYFTFLKKKDIKFGLIYGLLLGVTALFRVDIATQFLAGLTFANGVYHFNNSKKWFLTSTRHVSLLWLGFLIPSITAFFWLKTNGAHLQFLQSAVKTPAAFFRDQVLPFPKPWNIFPSSFSPKDIFSSYEAFFIYIIFLVYLCGIYQLLKDWKNIWEKTPELPTFLLIAIFTTPYIFSRPDLGHMVKGGIPAFFVAAYILEKVKKPTLKYTLLGIPLVIILVGIAQLVWWSRFFDTKLQTPNGIIRTNSGTVKNSSLVSVDTIKQSLEFIDNNSSKDDQILVVPYMAGLYFLSNRPSMSYVGNIYDSYIPDEQEYIERLKSLDIKVVIYDPVNTPPGFTKRLDKYYPKIHGFIIDNFKVVEKSPEGWLFLKRR